MIALRAALSDQVIAALEMAVNGGGM